MSKFPKPVNTQEEYMYGILVRVDALCNMMSSLIENYAEQNEVATTNNEEVKEEVSKNCQATTKSGAKCKMQAVDGTYCRVHQVGDK